MSLREMENAARSRGTTDASALRKGLSRVMYVIVGIVGIILFFTWLHGLWDGSASPSNHTPPAHVAGNCTIVTAVPTRYGTYCVETIGREEIEVTPLRGSFVTIDSEFGVYLTFLTAEGLSLGSLFLASREVRCFPNGFRKIIVTSTQSDTVRIAVTNNPPATNIQCDGP